MVQNSFILVQKNKNTYRKFCILLRPFLYEGDFFKDFLLVMQNIEVSSLLEVLVKYISF